VSHILLFANPISGRGRARALAGKIARRLRADGYRVQRHFEPPAEIRPEDLPHHAVAAVVIGGDGTLRTVADRLLAIGPLPPLVAVPMGTANLMGRQLKIPRLTLESAAGWVSDVVRGRHIIRLDAARANGELVLLMVGIGFDGEVVHDLARSRTGPIRMSDYLIPAARALGSYRFSSLRVIADGAEVFPSKPAIAFVGNSPEYGTGFPVLPLADPADGKMDLCVLPCRSRTQLLGWFVSVMAGTHLAAKGVVSLRAKHVRIESQRPVPMQIDGDPGGYTPLVMDLLPGQLSFMVPREQSDHG
jgi:diacylglycerol kinase (ATP)